MRLLKKLDPLLGNLQNSVPKGFIATPDPRDVCKFRKIGRPEIDKVVRYLTHKKQNFAWLSLLRGLRPKSAGFSGKANNVLRMCEISSKSVHLRRSYSSERVNSVKTHDKADPILG